MADFEPKARMEFENNQIFNRLKIWRQRNGVTGQIFYHTYDEFNIMFYICGGVLMLNDSSGQIYKIFKKKKKFAVRVNDQKKKI